MESEGRRREVRVEGGKSVLNQQSQHNKKADNITNSTVQCSQCTFHTQSQAYCYVSAYMTRCYLFRRKFNIGADMDSK